MNARWLGAGLEASVPASAAVTKSVTYVSGQTAFRHVLRAGVAAATLLLSSWAVSAYAGNVETTVYQTQYDVSYPQANGQVLPPITNVLLYQQTVNGSSVTWPFSINPTSGGGTDTILNPFQDPDPTTSAVLFGLVPDASDPMDQADDHVVLGLGAATAAAINGLDWNAIFPATSEQNLVDAILLATSGGPFCDASGGPADCINPAGGGLNEVFSFGGNDVSNIPDPANPGQFLDGQVSVPGGMTLLSFSDGTPIGSGTLSNVAVQVASGTPEPASWAMMLLGVGMIGSGLRVARRKITAPATAA
jgi:hypothetical protein